MLLKIQNSRIIEKRYNTQESPTAAPVIDFPSLVVAIEPNLDHKKVPLPMDSRVESPGYFMKINIVIVFLVFESILREEILCCW